MKAKTIISFIVGAAIGAAAILMIGANATSEAQSEDSTGDSEENQ